MVAGAGVTDAFAFAAFRGVGSGERTRKLANDANASHPPPKIDRHTPRPLDEVGALRPSAARHRLLQSTVMRNACHGAKESPRDRTPVPVAPTGPAPGPTPGATADPRAVPQHPGRIDVRRTAVRVRAPGGM